MQTKTLALLAVSASAAVASPFHRREVAHHFKLHGSGTGLRPTGSAGPFPHVNDTNGRFPTTSTTTDLQTVTNLFTVTISPTPAASEPVNFGNVADAETSCTSTSIATATSTNYVTVTASPAAAAKAADNDVSAGAFYGGQSRRPNWGQSQAPPAGNPTAPIGSYSVSTTFATMTGTAPAGSATQSSAVPSASSPPSGGSGGGKRGISFNDAGLVSAFGNAVSWSYNWAAKESGKLGVEFVPMMWGLNSVSSFASDAAGASHVLSFNEPDLGEQANIDPATAAKQHIAGMKSFVGKVQIGSPAVTNGGGSMGATWLSNFFKACGGTGQSCNVDFVAYHWYGGADAIEDFKSHTETIIGVANAAGISKVWLTEFAPAGSADAQASFMKDAVSFLDGNPAVERYAAFMASDGTLLSGGSLNNVGSAYASAS